jgi:hypothetical protein
VVSVLAAAGLPSAILEVNAAADEFDTPSGPELSLQEAVRWLSFPGLSYRLLRGDSLPFVAPAVIPTGCATERVQEN